MNILILNWRDTRHPLAGGAEISTHEHAKGWVKGGHRVTLFTSSFPGAKSSEEIDGVRIIRRGNHYTVHMHAFFHYMMRLRGKVDMVIDEFHFIPFFTPLYVKEKKIAFIHETAEEIWFKNKTFPISLLGYLFEPLFFRFYRGTPFMTVSKSTKKDLIKFGIKEQHVHIIQNGIAHIAVTEVTKEKSPTILYLGRLSLDKGIQDAIAAFSSIRVSLPKAVFWIAGSAETNIYKDRLVQAVRGLGIETWVKFLGHVTEKEKYELLRRSWVLIHPSVKEGWGLTVIEAASQGTPTVAYRASGLSDSIQDGETGILVFERNPRALAREIVVLCTNAKLYEKMSTNAKKWSKQFDWNTSIAQSLALIESTA